MQTNYFQRNVWRSHSICGQTITIYFQYDISKHNFGGNQGGNRVIRKNLGGQYRVIFLTLNYF